MGLENNPIESGVMEAYSIALKARKKGYDPEEKVEIPLARNLAERVIGLISIIAPEIVGKGIPERIKSLEKKYGIMDWRVALKIAEEIAIEKFCKFEDKIKAIETGIRVGFAYITMGSVASPLEGLVSLKLKKRRDNQPYFALYYAGPIRSAGGTSASVSVLIADYLRKKLKYLEYDPTEEEIKRMVTEVYDYHEKVTNLQYLPSAEEIEFLIKNLPVQIDGDASEDIEVSNYKDLKRIETNKIRGGACLVIAECLAQKAPKLWKQLSKWRGEFNLDHWAFLENFIKIQKKAKSLGVKETKITPDYTYIKDLVAGRPVLTHPLRAGGFRLRYGRSRISGYSASAIHPATSIVLNRYVATGTQLKVERPGKATAITFCETIEGPIVKLNDGSVIRIETEEEAKKVAPKIKEILFLGDILFNYGDFYNRAQPLIPAGYCEEFWIQELEKAIVTNFGSLDMDKLSEFTEIPKETLEQIIKNPLKHKLRAETALILSQKLNIPLYPRYCYHWKLISKEQLLMLFDWLEKMKITRKKDKLTKIILPLDSAKRILELIGLPHKVVSNEYVIIEEDNALALLATLNLNKKEELLEIKERITKEEGEILEIINKISKVKVRDKSGIFIGARMGRPEKAKMRKLTGSPHVLFPVGEEGGKQRSFQNSLEQGKISAEFRIFYCQKCGKETIFSVCESCDKKTKKYYYCEKCGLINTNSCVHGYAMPYRKMEIDIKYYFHRLIKKLDIKCPDLVKGVRGTSNKEHLSEHLIKGILRAKHGVYVNKDGTIRYDMTQLPITHFKPKEIGTDIAKLKELGYEKDIYGNPLTHEEQILELMPQDVILPLCLEAADEGADKALFKITKFIDELLTKFYGLKPYYNLEKPSDLVGHLVIALAPHTSAGIIARIIGFSKTQAFFAHPLLHAATRRDCDGDEVSCILLMDALLNFSRHYLPATRGSTQDAPLVLTSKLIPSEVDDMVFDMDLVWRYPLEFYEACQQYKYPWNVKIEQFIDKLDSLYGNIGYTHDVDDINAGVKCSAYKLLPSMEEKLSGQMELAEKIRAVDEVDVARLVIERHFLRDIKGNLRKFSMQQFRCVQCNEKFRRPPLVGKCTKCKGKLVFTISEGSVVKYLEPAMNLAKKYNLPSYLKQSLELIKRRVEGVFGKEKEKQIALEAFLEN